MADAENTPDKEPQDSAPEAGKEDAKTEAAVPEPDKGKSTELAEPKEQTTKLVAPEALPALDSAVPAAPAPDAVPASAAAEDAHGHAHDAHSGDGHAHDDHPVATDIIAENSLQDTFLSGLSMCVLLSFIWLVYTWETTVKLLPVTPEEPPGMQQH